MSQKQVREVWVSPYVAWFLSRFAKSDPACAVLRDIDQCMSPATKREGDILAFSDHRCLLKIIEPGEGSARERVMVWSGHKDGFFPKTDLVATFVRFAALDPLGSE